MSTRILLSNTRNPWGGWDAQMVDFKDFAELAKSDDVLWGDHIHVYADADYLPRAQEFIDVCEEIRWPDVIGFVEPFTQEMQDSIAAAFVAEGQPRSS